MAPESGPRRVSVYNIANALTALRLLLVPVFVWLLLHQDGRSDAWRYAAAGVFAIAVITDKFDGDIARARGLITDFGKMADPIADKALMGSALIGLSLLNLLPWWVTIVILVRELGITLLRFVVIRHGVIPASRGGKLKTLVQSVAIWCYIMPWDGVFGSIRWWLMGLAVALTVLTGLDYVARAIRLVRNADDARAGTAADGEHAVERDAG
ncbi:CDP-diacylglycerol--glycerol-3-phosphate 3-phosphatidyltransferase [Epidermidibacterium keratini]|uniref:CDP-diacylglycerol--glycerol-3-phosphate 3-phosphatidyltransferase n=1 Tax=Epidermidibacterium keratini TaxID=1891644 RepID=A0A7L4YRP1_9ACTN|nr:CDP-diacylglycerol--glycerol-3-phosphate 3-phosphatidyltransferase [Epidermidibacterium keratini]QHC01911.1 CDP-diacylglycerol--glycerol-3-phosphate 3-phosphatidyltransferase [Epidermidibacterium keratini]